MKIKFWILVVIIYKVPGNVSCKFKSYRGEHLCCTKKLQNKKSTRFSRSCAFFAAIFSVLRPSRNIWIQELHFALFFKKQDLNWRLRFNPRCGPEKSVAYRFPGVSGPRHLVSGCIVHLPVNAGEASHLVCRLQNCQSNWQLSFLRALTNM